MVVQRVTLFKIPDEKNIQLFLDAYKTLAETNQKDGKPYILELKARKSESGDRGKGYNVVGMTKFKSMEDVKYYDEECEAHKKLKAYGRDLVEQPWQPPLTVFFEDES